MNKFEITVRCPNMHHNAWGIEIRGQGIVDEDQMWSCTPLNRKILQETKEMDWSPFHQGGSHDDYNFGGDMSWNRCTGWHYWAFWGLCGPSPYLSALTGMHPVDRQLHYQRTVENYVRRLIRFADEGSEFVPRGNATTG